MSPPGCLSNGPRHGKSIGEPLRTPQMVLDVLVSYLTKKSEEHSEKIIGGELLWRA